MVTINASISIESVWNSAELAVIKIQNVSEHTIGTRYSRCGCKNRFAINVTCGTVVFFPGALENFRAPPLHLHLHFQPFCRV